MRNSSILLCTSLLGSLLLAPAAAQTQLVRGEVDSIQGTSQFRLDCTNIPVVTTVPGLDLLTLHNLTQQNDNMLEMQVVNVGTAAQPVLDIRGFALLPELFDMGNLRIGQSQSWEVFGPDGAMAFVFLNFETSTSYFPFGAAGTWVLGAGAPLFMLGTISQGRFSFDFTTPNLPGAIGIVITGQAVTLFGASLVITNPDCETIET